MRRAGGHFHKVLLVAIIAVMVSVVALSFCLALAEDVAYVSGKTASLKPQDTLTVRLEALPGAGYVWQPTTEGRPNLRFTQVKTLPIANGRVGGKQTMVFTFLATEAGDGEVTFNYGRPWEIKKGAKPTKTMLAKYSVKG